jgi:hypothetical protein
MSLNEKAMLVHLNISFWTARKYDRKVSLEIERQYNADKAGRYNKILIANEHLANIKKIISAARNFHYENTLPWNDNGGRLLPAANYFNYVKAMQEYRVQFEKEISNFIQVYPSLKQEARSRLNGLFNETDYPDMVTLKDKYAFTSLVTPVPEANDFRVKLNSSEVDSIRKSIEDQVKDSTREAMRDLWQRLYKVVSHMVERLSDPENKFKNSLVNNITDLCELLPKLNVTGDPHLNATLKQVKDKLTLHDSQTLRDDETARNNTAMQAQQILDKMKSYLPAA